MNNLNEVIVEGNLVRDPELKWLKENEVAVCRFSVAVNKRFKDRTRDIWVEDTSYFLVESWRGLATMCFKYLKKGTMVRVVGELKQSLWKDAKNDGKTRERVYIIAEHVEFKLPKKDEKDGKPVAVDDNVNMDASENDNLHSRGAREAMDSEAISREDDLPY